jgi:orotidine-5'-phosphate decarboxylase
MANKHIPHNQRLIVALDFPNITLAKELVEKLGDSVSFYKIGLELLMGGQYFEFIDWLAKKNKKVFVDLKLYDISNTIAKSVKNLSQYQNIHFLTIHSASKEIMQKAAENKGNMNILAVSVLTNLDQNDLCDMGFDPKLSLQDLVIKKTLLAKNCGIDGIVSSGIESKIIRDNVGDGLTIVSPGIRLESNIKDDQKRVVDVQKAFLNGVDYIVVGRPINSASDPLLAANNFQNEILKYFVSRV